MPTFQKPGICMDVIFAEDIVEGREAILTLPRSSLWEALAVCLLWSLRCESKGPGREDEEVQRKGRPAAERADELFPGRDE